MWKAFALEGWKGRQRFAFWVGKVEPEGEKNTKKEKGKDVESG